MRQTPPPVPPQEPRTTPSGSRPVIIPARAPAVEHPIWSPPPAARCAACGEPLLRETGDCEWCGHVPLRGRLVLLATTVVGLGFASALVYGLVR